MEENGRGRTYATAVLAAETDVLASEHEGPERESFGRREIDPRSLLDTLKTLCHVHLEEPRVNRLPTPLISSLLVREREKRTMSSGV